MRSLNDAALHRAVDPSGMLHTALALPRQLREGWRLGRAVDPRPLRVRPAHLVVAGMGGSAIGGDLLTACLAPALSFPMTVVRDARLPSYIGPHSLVVASSYSGETEETVAAAASALRAGAAVLAVTSGGGLGTLVESGGGAVVRVPGGLPPRAALGYLLASVLAVLDGWAVCPPCAGDVEETAHVLDAMGRDLGPDVAAEYNPAKRLAARFEGRIPTIYAAAPDVEPAARRWKCQFNENSKTVATWSVFPEMVHNENCGWGAPEAIGGLLEAVVLFAGDEPERTRRLVRAACEAMPRGTAGVHEVVGCGESRLSRLLSLVYVGDLTSVYLAYLRGIDPTPVEAIAAFKRRMREE